MGALERLRWSVVKTLLARESMVFANAVESWLFYGGSVDYLQKNQILCWHSYR